MGININMSGQPNRKRILLRATAAMWFAETINNYTCIYLDEAGVNLSCGQNTGIVPIDYISGGKIIAIVISDTGSGDVVLASNVSSAANGEALDANDVVKAAAAYTVVGDKITEIDITPDIVFTAGDYLGAMVTRTPADEADTSTNDLAVIAIAFEYLADL